MARFYIQDRRSGLFFRNLPYGNYTAADTVKPEHWTANRHDCESFGTKRSAIQSRGWVHTKRIRSDARCPLCEEKQRHGESYYRHWSVVEMTDGELPYQIVEVA